MKISFIGLGIMGSRMAANLVKNNLDLTVYNRSKDPVDQLIAKGAKTATSLNEAVKDADIVFSMLSKPEVVANLFFGKDGALSSMKNGATWVDCTTVNPSFSIQSKEAASSKGITFIDAPVAGTKPHAENAELVFFVGANQTDLKKVQNYLEMMGKKVLALGAVGKGASFKMLVNLMLAESMVIFSEAILLGEQLGFDKDFLLDTIPNLVVAAPFTKFKSAMIKSSDYEVQFPLEWMYKDLHLATLTAYEEGQPLQVANLVKEIYAAANKKGMGRLDFAAIHQYLEKN